ncbi:MAG TPA: hypothetical protein VF534_09515 [Paraburkholderia sp.]
MTDLLDDRIANRILECKRERCAYEMWLQRLSPANAMLVGVGGVISLVSGLSIVTKATLVSPEVAGWGAVLGAALTGLHARLKCDAHQAECKKLVGQLGEIQTEYERLQMIGDPLIRQKELLLLEHKLAAIRAGQVAKPSDGCTKRAVKRIV